MITSSFMVEWINAKGRKRERNFTGRQFNEALNFYAKFPFERACFYDVQTVTPTRRRCPVPKNKFGQVR